uniref:Uncharacterized protein n=1 Tax=Alexandrium monilatum TaxID=311494 RepID=A0A7S4Q3V0_9DINO
MGVGMGGNADAALEDRPRRPKDGCSRKGSALHTRASSLLIVLCSASLPDEAGCILTCATGEQVEAYYAGEVNLGAGSDPCLPTMQECWFPAEIESGPDEYGVYTVAWADGDQNFRQVHASTTRRRLTDEASKGGPTLGGLRSSGAAQ